MKLERQERATLHQALQQLIVGADELELFTQLRLDESLANITDDAPLPVMLLRVIRWCEARGCTESLVTAALQNSSNNTAAATALHDVLGAISARRMATPSPSDPPALPNIPSPFWDEWTILGVVWWAFLLVSFFVLWIMDSLDTTFEQF